MFAPHCTGRAWQDSYDTRLSCHSWHDQIYRSFSAMILLILFAALSVVGIAATAVAVLRDGYRAVPTDRSRLP